MVSGVCFRGWYVCANSAGVTRDPRMGPMEACAIHPTHPFCVGLMYPACCMVCMISGVHFRGWYICVISAGVGWEVSTINSHSG